ncbi:hypothetical protein SLA2020_051950 [Shorea laevis]
MASLASFAGLSTSVVFGHLATGVCSLPNKDKVLFGLKPSRGGRLCMSTHNVELITPKGPLPPFECPDNVYILTKALEKGIELPFNCREGNCGACTGKRREGDVDQLDGSYLSQDQMNEGYVLTCKAKPLSDVVIMTHKKRELMD